MFFGHVATRRGLKPDDVRAMKARTFDGAAAAIAAGLADKAGTLNTTLAEFRAHLDARRQAALMGGGIAQRQPAAVPSSSTAASAVTSPEEDTMSEPKADAPAAPAEQKKPDAAAPPATKPEAAKQEAAKPEAAAAPPVAEYDADLILAICEVGGASIAKAREFIAQKKSAKEVAAALQSARAKASGDEIVSHVAPNTGTAANTKPEDSPIVKAAERLAQAGKER
jgi:hypothetical protein